MKKQICQENVEMIKLDHLLGMLMDKLEVGGSIRDKLVSFLSLSEWEESRSEHQQTSFKISFQIPTRPNSPLFLLFLARNPTCATVVRQNGLWLTPPTKIGYTTPHYYPKYKI